MRLVVFTPFRTLFNFVRYNFLLKLTSIAIAATLWIVVFGSRTIEITKEVPFEVQLTDDQVLVDTVPEKIQFRLVAPKAFLRNLSAIRKTFDVGSCI